ncbi:MAG: SDR family NAD(P)-dependent oxidoreductase, partial [Pseudomonadota bacterium]
MGSKLFDLSGKSAIVTGASSGLGKTMAMALAGAGADVAICARTPEKIEAAAEEIRATGAKALGMSVDVRDVEQIKGLMAKALEAFGK